MTLYAGLMSGTSLDGVDGVLVDWPSDDDPAFRLVAHVHLPFAPALRRELLALSVPGSNELHRAALAANALARVYARTVHDLIGQSGVSVASVRAIGAHGQTVRHNPVAEGGPGYSLQLLNAALLAEICRIDVVCDFRSRDIAAGGQGAPLVPAFHAARFAEPGTAQAILNLGGIANLTLLAKEGRPGGFDCGPGNMLLDLWIERHRGVAFDEGGGWAATGRVIPELLQRMLSEPFFDRVPPKSTGRELFNADWLNAMLASDGAQGHAPKDVQATLVELTARSVSDALIRYLPDAERLYLCGGGALNSHLRTRLEALLPRIVVQATTEVGLPVDQVEAVAFAWLARAFILLVPGNLPQVTGASGPRVLGSLHRAG
jgi:anhydro-N-acetylmuramic acid kinase